MSYRIDSLPKLLRPLVEIYGLAAATLMLFIWGLLKITVRVRHVNGPADWVQRPAVECVWHEALAPYFLVAMPYRRPYAWLNHPVWYMRGVHIFLRWMGVSRLVLGSSGHGGRAALEQLIPLVGGRVGTFLNPDGPRGPAHEVKDGVLDLSSRTGLPVVAIRIRCRGAVRLPTWEKKLLPLPGGLIEATYSSPWLVTEQNREAIRAEIKRHLDGDQRPG